MRNSIRLTTFLILLTGLTACNLNLQYRGSPQAWIDAPLDGMVLPLASYDIVAHASDPGGISQIEFSINDIVIGNVSGSGALFNAHQPWTPSAPGKYIIKARGQSAGGAWSDYAEARVTVAGGATATPEAPATVTQTETPPPSPTVTLTPTPAVPTLILNINANCRLGPSQLYEVYTSILAGNQLPIEGTNEDGTWWLVRIPTGERCWISTVTGTPVGNINLVPVVQAPPLKGCYVFDPNQQKVCTVPCPPNANPGGSCTP